MVQNSSGEGLLLLLLLLLRGCRILPVLSECAAVCPAETVQSVAPWAPRRFSLLQESVV
jgi:hypothetical protein